MSAPHAAGRRSPPKRRGGGTHALSRDLVSPYLSGRSDCGASFLRYNRATRTQPTGTTRDSTFMTVIGSLQFCSTCGNLLDSPKTAQRATITCTVCQTPNRDMTAKSILTTSKPSDFPSVLRSKRSQVQNVRQEDIQTHAMSDVACERCSKHDVRYTTAQLRGADEGTTVYYSCGTCGHK